MNCSGVADVFKFNCDKPWGEGCTTHGVFSFETFWNITESIYQTCSNDSRLFQKGAVPKATTISLTQQACEAIAGPSWTVYPQADIFSRMTAWRFPLSQLIAIFPRPPLQFRYQLFVMLHLLGDPIDTISSLLSKLARCQQRALYWRRQFNAPLGILVGSTPDHEWKAVSIITEAYNEWGKADTADQVIRQLL